MDEKRGRVNAHAYACTHGKRQRRGHTGPPSKSSLSLLTRIRSAYACQRASATHRNASHPRPWVAAHPQTQTPWCATGVLFAPRKPRVWERWTLGNRGMRRRRAWKKRFVHLLLHDAGPCSKDYLCKAQGETGTDLLAGKPFVSPGADFANLGASLLSDSTWRVVVEMWRWKWRRRGGGEQQFIRVVFVRRHVRVPRIPTLGNPEHSLPFPSRSLALSSSSLS